MAVTAFLKKSANVLFGKPMVIKIGETKIEVPKFISEGLPKHQKDFDKFLKSVLTAQANKTRKKLSCEQGAFDMFANLIGGKK